MELREREKKRVGNGTPMVVINSRDVVVASEMTNCRGVICKYASVMM